MSLQTVRPLPAQLLDQTFEAFVFDWDGTAVPDRQADASPLRARLEALSVAGASVFIVSGTHLGNVDGQLQARPLGPGLLYLCLNRGSEVFSVSEGGPTLVERRLASAEEDQALDRAANDTVEQLARRGLRAEVVAGRLNRRKVDLIPESAWADPPKSRIGELVEAVTVRLIAAKIDGLTEAAAISANAARHAGLKQPKITTDVKHVEIGLTDKADSAHWAADRLAEEGITGQLILVVGDELGPLGGLAGSDSLMMVEGLTRAPVVSVGVEPEGVPAGVMHVGGGPEQFLSLLDVQLERRKARRVPSIDLDPAWVLALPERRLGIRAAEALGTLANGQVGTRGFREEEVTGSRPSLTASGVYCTDGLLPGPPWTSLQLDGSEVHLEDDGRLVDLRTGVLARIGNGDEGLRSVRFVSVADPTLLALRAEANTSQLRSGMPLSMPTGAPGFEQETQGEVVIARTGTPGDGEIVVAARDRVEVAGNRRTVQRLATCLVSATGELDSAKAVEALARFEMTGFDHLLAGHRRAWARRWANAEVTIEGDPELQLAARFAMFHLLSAGVEVGDVAVGARGLSGDAYRGHVLWDADVYVLPVLAAVAPAAARAMLEYRIRRLPAAREAATKLGRRGARFPWESARDGQDVTPRFAAGRDGEPIKIWTGQTEEHIVADVAWAAHHYVEWTGDHGFLEGPGSDLVVDTARYWASRVRIDSQGRGHIEGVMGPDEYHEPVDDNAFTNVMARWNLRAGADLVERSGDRSTAADWSRLATQLVDRWDPGRAIYEQFAGYFDLEPMMATEVAQPPVPADVVLGPDRIARSQLVKQADVLMLHHLVPDEVVPGSLGPCLDYYEPRTVHGSSLSPAIYASLLARAGAPERALSLLRLAARIDLDDLTGTTSGGLHLAAMGGLWQALAWGFLGLRARNGLLSIDPRLPSTWDALALRFRVFGSPVTVRAERGAVTVACAVPMRVRIADGSPVRCEPPGATFKL